MAGPTRPYAGRSATQRRAERIQRLRAAGLELFGTVGYGGTHIQALCREARVTARHFYELYPSTEALFREVYDDISGGCLLAIIAALGEDKTPAERFARGADEAVTYLLSDVRRARIQCVESHTISPAFLEHRNDVLRRYARLLAVEASLRDLPLTPLQQQLGAAALVSAADSILAAHVQHPESVRMEDCRAVLGYLLLRAARIP